MGKKMDGKKIREAETESKLELRCGVPKGIVGFKVGSWQRGLEVDVPLAAAAEAVEVGDGDGVGAVPAAAAAFEAVESKLPTWFSRQAISRTPGVTVSA